MIDTESSAWKEKATALVARLPELRARVAKYEKEIAAYKAMQPQNLRQDALIMENIATLQRHSRLYVFLIEQGEKFERLLAEVEP